MTVTTPDAKKPSMMKALKQPANKGMTVKAP